MPFIATIPRQILSQMGFELMALWSVGHYFVFNHLTTDLFSTEFLTLVQPSIAIIAV